MTAIPASLFVQFIQQGLEKGLISDITKTLDGEYYCNDQYLEERISELVKQNGKCVHLSCTFAYWYMFYTRRQDWYRETSRASLCRAAQREASGAAHSSRQEMDSMRWFDIDPVRASACRWPAYAGLRWAPNRDCVDEIKKDLQSKIDASGSLSIIAQTQQMKLPYSLLRSVGGGVFELANISLTRQCCNYRFWTTLLQRMGSTVDIHKFQMSFSQSHTLIAAKTRLWMHWNHTKSKRLQ